MLLHEILELAAADRPRDAAVVVDGRRISFAELDRRVADMATRVAGSTDPGDRLVLISDNQLDALVALYAVPRSGRILAFGNTRHTPTELMATVDSVDAVALLAAPDQLERLGAELDQRVADGRPELTVWSIGGDHPSASLDLSDALEGSSRAAGPAAAADDRSPAWIIHTSGTTGAPKGVVLTHRNLVAATANTAVARPMADDDVYLFPFPLFHVAAYNVLHAHLRRRPVVLVARFDTETVLDLVQTEHVTNCSLAPTMISMLLDHTEDAAERLSSLRQISYGASAMPLDLMRRLFDELPDCGLAQGYGMTELGGNAVFLTPADHRRAATSEPELLSAAGRPGPLATLRIVDDDDREVLDGRPGEILVRGDQVCDGYWNDPAATATSRLGPWLRTGDVGRIDDAGVLHVVDRKKDIIITGGENVASREVEDVVGEHPAVGQVAVVGVPHERWGEQVCAVVVAAPGRDLDADELVSWTDGRLAGFKRPKVVHIVDALPMNASGKIDKRQVRELLTGA